MVGLMLIRYTAIVRGAVLHGLRLPVATQCVIGRCYGTMLTQSFNGSMDSNSINPTEAKYDISEGGIMKWFVIKVRFFPDHSE